MFIKSDFKIGVLYVKHGQQSEDEIFSNTSHSTAFEMFLHLLGDRVNLKDFNNYSGGLDTSNSLNGTQSIYTEYRSNRIMFHVPTMMPNPVEDKQYVSTVDTESICTKMDSAIQCMPIVQLNACLQRTLNSPL